MSGGSKTLAHGVRFPRSIADTARRVFLVLAAITGCAGLPLVGAGASIDNKTLNAGLDPTQRRILAIVAYFERNGIRLEHEPKSSISGTWRVVHPPGIGFDVSIRTLPQAATKDEMDEALRRISLAYRLNPRAHIAMSYPMGDAREGQSAQVAARLAELFARYDPDIP